MTHMHFVGIGGAGMSGLAHIALARGHRVTGSDACESAATRRLRERGAQIAIGQSAPNVLNDLPDLVVVSAAIGCGDEEVAAARAAGVPIVSRAAHLGTLMAEHRGPRIGVTGTHGKTTTTAMLAEILRAGALDPTVLIGGDYAPIGGNVMLGGGGSFLTEACEAYESFLELAPDIGVVTNVDADHLDHYGTSERVDAAYAAFARRVRPGGVLVWCADDPGCRRLVAAASEVGGPRRVSFGVAEDADLRGVDVAIGGRGSRFAVERGGERLGSAMVAVPGAHNVLNALGAATAALEAGVAWPCVVEGLSRFGGVGRRFEQLGEAGGVTVVDDYAHHPAEIRATISAARTVFPGRRLVVVFQPHLYSRTRDFLDGFAEELSSADAVLVTGVYAARERPIEGLRVSDIVRGVGERSPSKTAIFLPDKHDAVGALAWVTRPGDVVLVMGAGDIREVGEEFVCAGRASGEGCGDAPGD
ncbi:MAG: UDP-N-acetylmuramate--L-alanine ligase [Chthonomonadales bacterium]|nr:UDP-N-acetylmuramate--L-alanine ligase [Chthonomonadales bacterium]